MGSRDKVAEAFSDFAKEQKSAPRLTNGAGAPIDAIDCSLSIGKRGPILLQDTTFLEHMGRFDRERIPERVVHAKGAGAFGYFETTHDVTKYTKLKPFEQIGKKTRLVVRFSTVGGERGSADTARDPRGFAIKFYTEDGNWDLVGNNTPIFFIRDPILFPHFIHTQKRNPRTHCKDPDMFWDFISLRPETCHQVSFLFSDRGVPDGYRHMNGYGSHTFKLVNSKGEAFYGKFHFKTDQGIKCIYQDRADVLAGSDADYAIRDLYNAIADGNFPSWTLYLQIMTFDQAEKVSFDPFDLTKIWPHKEFPLIPVGKMVLDENPKNYFNDVEQSAFSPAHMIPGVEPSPDRMLLGRLFSYGDTHFHRLGTNYQQLPVNRPRCHVNNYQVDGPQTIFDHGGAPNYYPNSFSGPEGHAELKHHQFKVTGDVVRHNSKDEDNFSQAGDFYRKVLKEDEKDRLTSNIAGHLKNAAEFIQRRTVEMFGKVDPDYGNRIQKKLDQQKK